MHYKNYLLLLLIAVLTSCASKKKALLNEDGTINADAIVFVKDYVEPEETFPTGSALIDSAGEGKLELVKSFIKYVEVNHRTRYGTTALMSSAKYSGNKEVTLFLIESGADLNAQANNGNTALINAVQSAHTHIVKLLIDSGATVNLRNKAGMSAIDYAKEKGDVEIISLLKVNGAFSNSSVNLKKEINTVFEANGTKAWCAQKDYLECLVVTPKKCNDEQRPLIPRCLEYANEMTPHLVGKNGAGEFSIKFMECMFNEHVFENYNNDKEILSCISNAKVESSLLLKHVYEIK